MQEDVKPESSTDITGSDERGADVSSDEEGGANGHAGRVGTRASASRSAAKKKASKKAKSKRKQILSSDDEEDVDAASDDDDDEGAAGQMVVRKSPSKAGTKHVSTTKRGAPSSGSVPKAKKAKQTPSGTSSKENLPVRATQLRGISMCASGC